MAGGCDLGVWQSNSMIISAVSDAPDGPYDQQIKPVTPPWTHNAMISKHPNGSYLLFHIGPHSTWVPPSKVKHCGGNVTDRFYPFPAGITEPAPATTHISESLHGPWRPAVGVPGVNNPAPFLYVLNVNPFCTC
jgi:hypothetical protein